MPDSTPPVKDLCEPKLTGSSLILATCDRQNSVRVAVSTALAALPDDGELIVVDDGNQFDAASIFGNFDDPRMRLIKTSGREGPSAARNIGAAAAKGDVLFFLDDDDAMVKDYLVRILAGLESGQINAAVGFSAMQFGQRTRGKSRATGVVGPDETLSDRLCGLGMGFWILNSKFKEFGGLDETYLVNEDTEFCLRLASKQEPVWYDAVPGVVIRPAGNSDDGNSATLAPSRGERSRTFFRLLQANTDLFTKFPNERHQFALRAIKYGSLDRNLFANYKLAQWLLPGENRFNLICQVVRLSLSERLARMFRPNQRSILPKKA